MSAIDPEDPIDPKEVILDVLAVAEDGLTLGHLSRLCRQAGVRTEDDRKPAPRDVYAWVETLASSENVTLGQRVQMLQPDAEQRARRLLRDGRYREIAERVAAVEPSHDPRWGIEFARQGTLTRDLRRALVEGDDELADTLLKRGRCPVWRWFANPLAPDLFHALTPYMAGKVADALSRYIFEMALPLEGFDELVEQLSERHGTVDLVLVGAREAMLRGEHEFAQAELERVDPTEGTHLHALAALLRHDVAEATKLYTQALADLRRRKGSSKSLPRDPASVFLPLAYLLHGTKTRANQGHRIIVLARQKSRVTGDSPWGGWGHLPRLRDPVHETTVHCTHPIAVLLEGLCAWWGGRTLDPTRRCLAIETATRCGWSWIADALTQGPDGDGLVTLKAVRAEWEVKLEALAEALDEGRGKKRKPAEKRIAWTLEAHGTYVNLDAREQTRTAKGWSSGRAISNKRLLGHGKKPDMTPADLALVEALRTETFRGYRGYRETQYRWDADVAWAALAGHPAIFDTDNRPITVVEVQPRLDVKSVDGTLRLCIDPPVSLDGLEVTQVGNGYEVLVLSEKQRKVAAIIGQGIRVPDQASAALDDVLTATEGIFVRAQSHGPRTTREAAPGLVVLLRPDGKAAAKTMSAEIVAQPLGPDGARFQPGEGSQIVLGQEDGHGVRVHRDLAAERANMDVLLAMPGLATAVPSGDRWHLGSATECLELLEALRTADVAVFWPDEADVKFRRTVGSDDLQMSVKSNHDWFETDGKLVIDSERVLSLGALLDAVLRTDNRFIQLDDGSFFALEASLRRDLGALARTVHKRNQALAVHPLATSALETLSAATTGTADPRFAQHLAQLRALPDAAPVPSALRATLRGYQEDAFVWLARLAHVGAGAMLADDMGLGKTVVSLALFLHRRGEGPALLVAPTSVAGNWVREMARFAPSLTPLRIRDAANRAEMVEAAGEGDVVICSYGLLAREGEMLADTSWATVIFDESQALKNPSTQRHKAAAKIPAGQRVVLTGTPIENHLGELHAQFSIINPGMLGSKTGFRSRFQRLIEAGDRSVRRELKNLIAPYMLRRTKAQVLDELPPRTEIDVLVELSADEAALYEAQRVQALAALEAADAQDSAVAVLAHLTRLRLLACSPRLVLPDATAPSAKLKAFIEIVERLQQGGHRALVFSQFVKHLTLLREWLDAEGIRYQYLDGATPSRQRDARVSAFQSGADPLFLISLRAGGQGLNLTAADYVIHMDPWWNPAVEDQASDRAHRMGQLRAVTIYRLIASGTVEEQILALHKTKRTLAQGILEGADTVTGLSAAQLLAMMRGD